MARAKAQVASDAIRVEGLDDLRRSLKRLSPDTLRQFRRDLKGVAEIVASSARSEMPEDTGAAKRSVRASTAGSYAQIRGGGTRAPYYGWLDYGGTLKPTGRRRNTIRRPVVRGGRYLYPAISRNRPRLVRAAEVAVRRAIRSANLG